MERNPSFPFLSERTREAEEESILFSLTHLRPHPNPLPKGEGVYQRRLGTLRNNQSLAYITAYDVGFALSRIMEIVGRTSHRH